MADLEPTSAPPDTAELVERWMVAQLRLERQYFQHLGTDGGRRLRLLSLLEMDTLTQLPDSGLPVSEVAQLLDVKPPVARAVVTRLARRGLVRRLRGLDRTWTVHRTERADDLIRTLRRAQAGLIGSILGTLDAELRDRLVGLMADGALSLSSDSSATSRPSVPRPREGEKSGGPPESSDNDWVI